MDDEKILWVVVKYESRWPLGESKSTTIFRTRYAARSWRVKMIKKSNSWKYKVHKAAWGPDN